MSIRRSQFALDHRDSAHKAGLRVSRLILNVIVVGIIITVAIITAQLAGGTA